MDPKNSIETDPKNIGLVWVLIHGKLSIQYFLDMRDSVCVQILLETRLDTQSMLNLLFILGIFGYLYFFGITDIFFNFQIRDFGYSFEFHGKF